MTSPIDASSKPAARYEYIDALRGIAAILVVIYHSLRAYERNGWPTTQLETFIITLCNDWLNFGKMGVAVFFIISGFVIPSSLKSGRPKPLLVFAISRLARLYPAYWLSLLTAVLVYIWVDGVSLSPATIIANITMLQQFLGFENVIDVYWTLQIEIIFYVLCAGLFWANQLGDMKKIEMIAWAFLAAAVALATVRWLSGMKLPVAVPLALFLMFAGYVFRDTLLNGGVGAAARAKRLGIGFFVMMPLISILAYNVDMGFGERWYSYTFSYLLAFAATTWTIFKVRGRFPILAWCGKVSYSNYLFHYLVIVAFVHLLQASGVVPFSIAPFLLAIIVTSLIISGLVYRFVEEPFIQIGRKVSTQVSHVPTAKVADNVV